MGSTAKKTKKKKLSVPFQISDDVMDAIHNQPKTSNQILNQALEANIQAAKNAEAKAHQILQGWKNAALKPKTTWSNAQSAPPLTKSMLDQALDALAPNMTTEPHPPSFSVKPGPKNNTFIIVEPNGYENFIDGKDAGIPAHVQLSVRIVSEKLRDYFVIHLSSNLVPNHPNTDIICTCTTFLMSQIKNYKDVVDALHDAWLHWKSTYECCAAAGVGTSSVTHKRHANTPLDFLIPHPNQPSKWALQQSSMEGVGDVKKPEAEKPAHYQVTLVNLVDGEKETYYLQPKYSEVLLYWLNCGSEAAPTFSLKNQSTHKAKEITNAPY